MEDPRLSRMYAALVAKRFEELRRGVGRFIVMHYGLLMMVALTMAIVGLAIGWRAHRLGEFAKLRTGLKKGAVAQAPAAPRPGGQDAIVLQRSQALVGMVPEFVSATLLPGRGMNVFQITAYLPHSGEVQLLASPALDKAARQMDGSGVDSAGGASLTSGGAFETPWAGRIPGVALSDGTTETVIWRGRVLSLPVALEQHGGGVVATGGLLLKRGADRVKTNVMPDGGEAQAIFNVGNFDGHWVSNTEITTSVQLSSRALELKVIARNSGDTPEPIGIGWRPRFAILSGNRGQMALRLPSAQRAENRGGPGGLPTGKLLPVTGTEYDFTARNGAPLGRLNLDDTFVHLHPAPLDNGPIAEVRDTENNYGLRMTAMTATIKAMHVLAPIDANFVSIDPRFNYDDPFGHEWHSGEDTGVVVLQPGQSVQWMVRLEIFSLTTDPSQRF